MSTDVSLDLLAAVHENPTTATRLILDLLKPYVDSSVQSAVAVALNQRLQAVGLTEEISGLASLLAGRSNDGKSEVLRKALMLYGLALDALEKGNRLAIIDSDDMILHDVIGFDQSQLVLNSAAD